MTTQGGDLLDITVAGALTTGVKPNQIEVPYNCDVADVTLDVGTAPTGSDLIVDVLANGTSIFGATLGHVANLSSAQAAGGGWDASSTDLLFTPASDGAVQAGMTIKAGSEEIKVGSVVGDPHVEGGATSVVKLTGCTRGANGTSAATHAANVTVTAALPRVPAGQTKSSSENRGASNPAAAAQLSKGDVLSAQVTAIGSSVAGSDLTVNVQVVRR